MAVAKRDGTGDARCTGSAHNFSPGDTCVCGEWFVSKSGHLMNRHWGAEELFKSLREIEIEEEEMAKAEMVFTIRMRDIENEDVGGSIVHAIWSHWMEYFFSQCRYMDGLCVVPGDKVEQWKRQMRTGYWDLSEKEKESDRRVALDFLLEYMADD